MKSGRTFFGAAAACAMVATGAFAGLTGYVDNPAGNSSDWTNAILGMGGVVNADIDFESHPLGPLDPNHYSGLGATLGQTGGYDVRFGEGPAQGNHTTEPLHKGEGPHPASNFLFAGDAGTFTISFDRPVLGIGLFTVDLFNPNGANDVSIEAYDGPNGTGNLLGSFSAADFNFQANNGNNMYFMGVTSDQGNLRSLVFVNPGGAGDDLGIDKRDVRDSRARRDRAAQRGGPSRPPPTPRVSGCGFGRSLDSRFFLSARPASGRALFVSGSGEMRYVGCASFVKAG